MHARIASAASRIELFALSEVPLIGAGDDLAAIIVGAAERDAGGLADGDVVVIAQKIVSKAENRLVVLDEVVPSARALALAAQSGKDARIVELILGESTEVLRCRPGLIVVVHRLGLVLANAGIDQSNLPQDGVERALLLPLDPDGSAEALHERVWSMCRVRVGVIINDSIGRAWRRGTVGTALGVAGLAPLVDLRGTADLFGRTLRSTIIAHADEAAAAASLLQGQADEKTPVVVMRGVARFAPAGTARDLLRPAAEDLFR